MSDAIAAASPRPASVGQTTIVVGVDMATHSQQAFDSAFALARDLQAQLVIVHAFGTGRIPAVVSDETVDQLRDLEAQVESAEAHDLTTKYAEKVRRAGLQVDVIAAEDKPAALIVETARARNAGIIVVGRRQRNLLERMFSTSVSEAVVRRADRPVLVVPER